jgi:hypothetical protein
MFDQYRAKKKVKIVDPHAPPRPTLLGHEKEMKVWREQFGSLAQQNNDQKLTVKFLERKVNRLQSQVDALTSIIKKGQ